MTATDEYQDSKANCKGAKKMIMLCGLLSLVDSTPIVNRNSTRYLPLEERVEHGTHDHRLLLLLQGMTAERVDVGGKR